MFSTMKIFLLPTLLLASLIQQIFSNEINARIALAQRLATLATRLSTVDKSSLECRKPWDVLSYLHLGHDEDKIEHVVQNCLEKNLIKFENLNNNDIIAILWINVIIGPHHISAKITDLLQRILEKRRELCQKRVHYLQELTVEHVMSEMGLLNASASTTRNKLVMLLRKYEYKSVSNALNVNKMCSLLTLAATSSEMGIMALEIVQNDVKQLQLALWKNHFVTPQVDPAQSSDLLGLLWMLTGRGGSPNESKSALILSLCILHSRLRIPDNLLIKLNNAISQRSIEIDINEDRKMCSSNNASISDPVLNKHFGMASSTNCHMQSFYTSSHAFYSLNCDSLMGTLHTDCTDLWRLLVQSESSFWSITTSQRILDADHENCWQIVPKIRRFSNTTTVILYNPSVLVASTLNIGRSRAVLQALFDEMTNFNRWVVGRINDSFVGVYSHKMVDVNMGSNANSVEFAAQGAYNIWILHTQKVENGENLDSFQNLLSSSELEVQFDFNDVYLQCLNTYKCLDNGPLTLLWCLRQPKACPIEFYENISTVAKCFLARDLQDFRYLAKCLATQRMRMGVKFVLRDSHVSFELDWDDY